MRVSALALATFLLVVSTAPAVAQQAPEPAKQAAGGKPAASTEDQKPLISKEVWKWAELVVKLLVFLSFWCVSTEVIELPDWQKILDRTALGVGILGGVLVFFVVVRSTTWNSPPEEKEADPRLYIPLRPPPSVSKDDLEYKLWDRDRREADLLKTQHDLEKMEKKLNSQNARVALVERLWAWIKVNIPGIATIFGAYFLAAFAGVVTLGIVRLVLSGTKDRLSSKHRLIVGAAAFAIAGVLDIAVWAFKPD